MKTLKHDQDNYAKVVQQARSECIEHQDLQMVSIRIIYVEENGDVKV